MRQFQQSSLSPLSLIGSLTKHCLCVQQMQLQYQRQMQMTMQQQLRAQQALMQAQLRAAQAQVQQYQEQVLECPRCCCSIVIVGHCA